jgi:hypothetical protein
MQAGLGNLGGVILLALCTRIIGHPKNICQKTLFIPTLYPIIIIDKKTLFTIFKLFTPELFIICISINLFIFSKFLPMNVG